MFAIESVEREERFEFLDAVDLCAADRSFGSRQHVLDDLGWLLQHMLVEKAQRADRHGQGAGGQLVVAQQMQEIAPDLLVAQLVRRPLIELGQPGDNLFIAPGRGRLFGQWEQLTELHQGDIMTKDLERTPSTTDERLLTQTEFRRLADVPPEIE